MQPSPCQLISKCATLGKTADVVEVGPAEARWIPLAVQIPASSADHMGPGAHPLAFEIQRAAHGSDPAATVTEKSTFVIPR